MYEIIYSVFYNDYVIRDYSTISNVKPLFIGTLDECSIKLSKIKGF